MAKVGDFYVGSQLFCGVAEHAGVPVPPVGLGIGPTKIRGAGFIAGPLIVGDPFSFTKGPNVNEANLMIARCGNPEALPPPPSILKISSLGFPSSPIDVVIGDIVGPVGVTVFCGPQPFTVQASIIDLITIEYFEVALTKIKTGITEDIGAKVFGGTKVEFGVDTNLALAFNAAPIIGDAPFSVPDYTSPITTLNTTHAIAVSKKSFDIPHPTKENHRLRYICLEGPGAEVYFRGKLEGTNIIEIPEYWTELVDSETITVNLTATEFYQELYVEKIENGRRIILRNNTEGPIKCHYTVYGERKDVEKNIPEYKGLTPSDYPGDNDEYNINSL